jgi:hypothetical protein
LLITTDISRGAIICDTAFYFKRKELLQALFEKKKAKQINLLPVRKESLAKWKRRGKGGRRQSL